MAEYSKKEFAALCGITPSALSNNITGAKGRAVKVKVNAAGKIDSTDPTNAYFLQKKLAERKIVLNNEVGSDASEEETNTEAEAEFERNVNSAGGGAVVDIIQLDRHKKQLDINKISEEIEILKVKKEKLHGEVIPTDAVKMVLVQHTKSIVSEFQTAADNLIVKIAKQKGLNLNEQAELRGYLVDQINIAAAEAITTTKKSIKTIVNEYATKRGIGERG